MKKILFVLWDAFMQKGMENALKRLGPKMGFEYETFFYRFSNWDSDDIFTKVFEGKLNSQTKYDAVLMVNFAPIVSDVCERLGVTYISWIYDCPLHIRRTDSLRNSCNRLYFFDKGQASGYQKMGIKNAFSSLLAVDTSIFDEVKLSKEDMEKYGCDVSLVGKLYKSEYEQICTPLGQRQRGFLEGVIAAQSKIYGGYFLGDVLDDKLLKELNETFNQKSNERVCVSKEELEFTLNCEITGRERFMALALLSNYGKVNVYSRDKDVRLKGAHFGGYLDYYGEMPKAFKASKINLNISLKAIQTGIPLRVYDVLGCEGFLLTNYQQEIAENFVDGKELVMYESIEDLVLKAKWYLEHEEERKIIAHNGYMKVKQQFTFDNGLERILGESL